MVGHLSEHLKKIIFNSAEDVIVGRGCGMDAAGEDLFTGRTSCCYDAISSSRGWAIWGVLTVVRSIWTNVLSVLQWNGREQTAR